MQSIIMLVLLLGLLYLLIIRPESKRKKDAKNLRASLAVGDEVTTIGGIVGTICTVKDNTVVLETGADRVRIEFTKWGISSKGVQPQQ